MVSVDTVYQRVLALSNKEQRGYITPQEFNLLANQALMGIFEEYFHHQNQYLRNPGNSSASSDSLDYIQDKISRFHVTEDLAAFPKGGHLLPSSLDMYRLEQVTMNYGGTAAQQVTSKQLRNYNNGVYAARVASDNPIYLRESPPSIDEGLANITSDNFMRVFDPNLWTQNVFIEYIRMPKKVNWGYVVVNEKALYNANTSTNFDLHPSEETTLVFKILELSGIVINKTGLSSYAKTESVEQSNTEKQ